MVKIRLGGESFCLYLQVPSRIIKFQENLVLIQNYKNKYLPTLRSHPEEITSTWPLRRPVPRSPDTYDSIILPTKYGYKDLHHLIHMAVQDYKKLWLQLSALCNHQTNQFLQQELLARNPCPDHDSQTPGKKLWCWKWIF